MKKNLKLLRDNSGGRLEAGWIQVKFVSHTTVPAIDYSNDVSGIINDIIFNNLNH